jgi:hypothetical protein
MENIGMGRVLMGRDGKERDRKRLEGKETGINGE